MLETDTELDALQRLLDTSLARSTPHLRSIVTPGEHAVDARGVCAATSGMRTVTVATVTASGEPRVSAVDGHFLHGRWVFGTERSSAKARHLLARPAVSVAYVRGEQIGVFTHGRVETLNPAGGPEHADHAAVLAHLTAHYGQSPQEWGDVVLYRVDPGWMVAYAADPAALPD